MYPSMQELDRMTAQDVFDHVARHLLTQRKAAIEHGRCRYRTDDGLACAVGCLIPDAHFRPTFEGMDSRRLRCKLVDERSPLAAFFLRFETLLLELQMVHDSCHVLDWASSLAIVARREGLAAGVVYAAMQVGDRLDPRSRLVQYERASYDPALDCYLTVMPALETAKWNFSIVRHNNAVTGRKEPAHSEGPHAAARTV
jgi:hypothetical protein